MTQPTDAPNEPSTTPNEAPASAAPDDDGSRAPEQAGARAIRLRKLAEHPRVQKAVNLAKEHPLGAVVAVGAAAAFVEIPFAVGVLTGLGATALLAQRTGREARRDVLARGKQAVDRARTAVARRRKSSPVEQTSSEAGPAATPPA